MLKIRKTLTRVRALAGRLRRDDGGLAFIEFAMSLPVVVTFAFCGLEAANLAMAHLRVANIAMLTADNASRVRDSIDEANVIELFTGAKMTGEGIQFRQNGRIILSSIENTDNDTDNNNGQGNNPGGCDPSNPAHGSTCGNQWVRWQRCDGARNATSAYGTQGNSNLARVGTGTNAFTVVPGTAVMVVEVEYNYQPLISASIFGPRVIRYESAFNVRQRIDQVIKNANSVTPRTCNLFNP